MSSNITIVRGNIFNTKAQTIVNTVNCVGVMGKGIALVFKLRYPFMFDIYKGFCKSKHIGIGKLWLYKGEPGEPWVLNFPTKFHWKYPSKIEYIELGLEKFVASYKEKGITSIAFPMLGTNNGGLSKEDIESYTGEKVLISEGNPDKPSAPGQLLKHYAPAHSLRINAEKPEENEFFIGFGNMKADLNLSLSGDLHEAAANLFAYLRLADKLAGSKNIAMAPVPENGLGLAINDRIRRAAHK